jgi:regulation of enolase protein 1 (concanavalin A-like superfamily)
MQWHHEPPAWRIDGDRITAQAGPKTDFWRKTYDGGMRDHGHFYYQPVTGDFKAEVKVSGEYASLYDHAGLMVRLDETRWMKCGIEFLNGVQHASAVITRDWSDWSIVPLANPPAIWLRVVRYAATLEVSYSLDGQVFTLIRQGHVTEEPTVNVGIMIAAPTGDGFAATFEGFRITQS